MINIETLLKMNDKSGKIFKLNYIKTNYSYLYNQIIEYCEKNNINDLPFKQKMYHYHFDIPNIKKCYCGNELYFINFNKGYCKHCSSKCAHNDKDVIEKTTKTILEKYGVDNVQKSDIVKEKTYTTNLEKYGHKHASQSKYIQEKMKKTNIKRLGVEFPSQNISVRNKYYKSIIEKNLIKYNNLINIDYKNKEMLFHCDFGEDHNFKISIDLFQNRKRTNIKLCTICNTKFTSQAESNFLTLFNEDAVLHNRNIISPLELDIYMPDLKLAFEFNGLYWHSEVNKENNYHLNKTEKCEEQGIQLIHIYEDDWLYKQDIVKSIILNKLGKSDKIYARKTKIKEIDDNKLIKDFLNKNHIQGFIGSKIKMGLFYNDELVSLMTFGNRRVSMGKKLTKNGEYELLRFCNKLNTNVIGGASKLFKYFIDKYKPEEITTYADRSHSQGDLYKFLGFECVRETEPNYYYIIDGVRKHRFNFRKDKLIKEGFDPNKTEHEIMLERKIYRIYDSGSLKFIYKKSS